MHDSTCIFSRAIHYRRQAIAARQRAAQALEASSVALFEEVANHWTALAEQVEWLERSNASMARSAAKGHSSSYAPLIAAT